MRYLYVIIFVVFIAAVSWAQVDTLVDGEKQAGRHQVTLDASGYSSGVYFYRIEAGNFMDTKRMIFLK